MRLSLMSVIASLALSAGILATASTPALAAAGCSSTTPALGQTVTCTTYGTESITIPSGAFSVSIVATGGGGGAAVGSGSSLGGNGGGGAIVSAEFEIGQGSSTLSVAVGSAGGGGQNYWHYGAWGGGYSAVSNNGTPLVIAGGGGGGGMGYGGYAGGVGGSGGAVGGPDGGPGGGGAPVGTGGGGGGGGGSAGIGGAAGSGGYTAVSAGDSWASGGGGGYGTDSSGMNLGSGISSGGGGYGGGGGGGMTGCCANGGGGAGGSYASPTQLIGSASFSTSTNGAGAPGAAPAAGVTANGGNGGTGEVRLTFNAAPSPTITSVSPTSGPVAGGSSIYVNGTNLSGATSVTFGSATATITGNTSTRVTVTLPTGYGTKDVSVTTTAGSVLSPNAFTYSSPTIGSISPNSGPATGGTSVYVNGTNLTYATGVTFGGVAGTMTAVSDTRVTVLTPVGATAGSVDVVVSASGPASATSTGGFTYTPTSPGAPTIESPTAGDSQASVSFSAPAFTGGTAITSYTVTSSPGGITASGASSPILVSGLTNDTSYTFTVVATNSSGNSTASSASVAITPRAAGGGGSTSGTSGGSTAAASSAPASLSSAPTTATSPAVSTSEFVTAAKRQGEVAVRLPKVIAVPGSTVLIPRTLYTSEGVRVTAKATVAAWPVRSMPTPPRSSLGARIVRYQNGRIVVVTTGTRPVVVHLVLTAPSTSTSQAYVKRSRWAVPRVAR